MPTLDRDGEVFLLHLGDDENRFSPDWVAEVSELLDEVAAADAPRALVTKAGGKIWSNGLDLDWLGHNAERIDDYVLTVQELFAKVLTLPVPTVAALQGHTFAAGAMLALAHDWRVMREDRGWWCLPEADIRIPFSPGMGALIQAKLTPAAATDAMLTAKRFPGPEALAAGIVTKTASEDDVLATAVELARAQAPKDGATLGTIKQRMYATVVDELRDAERNRLTI
jgi:enoyl-CoA hydratase/carnithine racemase